jgi:hypothetical protein
VLVAFLKRLDEQFDLVSAIGCGHWGGVSGLGVRGW